MKHIPLLIVLSLCIPAQAQDPEVPSTDAILETMAKAGGTSTRMADYLTDNGVAVEFDESITDARSRRSWKSGGEGKDMIRVILLNPNYATEADQTPALPASLIAFEAAELMYGKMPESAEKRYITVAVAAQTFFELDGDIGNLGTVSDPKWAESLNFWVEHSPRKGVKALKKQGAKSLSDIELSAQDSLSNLRQSNGQAMLYGALSGNRGRLGWGVRSSFLSQAIDGSKSRLKTIRTARKDYKDFKKYDKSRRTALKG